MKIENSQSILYSPLKLCRSFLTVFCQILATNHISHHTAYSPSRIKCPGDSDIESLSGGPENSIYVDIYIQIISPSCIYPGCDAGTAQPPPGSKESVSAYSPSGPYYCLLTPVSQKGVLYFFYFEWNLWSEAMFFNFMIALSSTSSSQGD